MHKSIGRCRVLACQAGPRFGAGGRHPAGAAAHVVRGQPVPAAFSAMASKILGGGSAVLQKIEARAYEEHGGSQPGGYDSGRRMAAHRAVQPLLVGHLLGKPTARAHRAVAHKLLLLWLLLLPRHLRHMSAGAAATA